MDKQAEKIAGGPLPPVREFSPPAFFVDAQQRKFKKFKCPCCGCQTLTEISSYEICDVCGWEDDPVQSSDPTFAGGANKLSLDQARVAWQTKLKKQ